MSAATAYTCRVMNWSWFGINLAILAVLVFCGVDLTGRSPLWQQGLFVVLIILNLALSALAIGQRVAAGPAGLTVSLGPFGFPRIRFGRERIVHAEPIYSTLELPSLPGVFVWKRKRGWFLVPKLGPALRLRLTSGRTITISMPDPAAAMWAMGIAP